MTVPLSDSEKEFLEEFNKRANQMTLPINQIVCGDNCEVLGTFPADCIDLVVTSPPYDNLRTYGGHEWDFEGVAAELWRVIKPGGVVVWVVADATIDGSETGTSFRQALRLMELGFRLHDTMIYQKGSGGAVGSNLAYWQYWEYMLVLAKGKPAAVNLIKDKQNVSVGHLCRGTPKTRLVGSRDSNKERRTASMSVRSNVWTYYFGDTHGDNTKHPAPFPEALARDHILSWSNEGDIVLDPFCGSGTTAKMAKHMGRRWIGIEVNPEYCEIAENRLRQEVLF